MKRRSPHGARSGSYQSQSGWNALLPPRPAPGLEADASCALAVVGAGYTGLAAARRWAELRRDDRVVVLESLTLGEGNPGRNSGFLLEVALAEDADPAAVTRMSECSRLIRETLAEMVALAGSRLAGADLARRGTYRAAASEAGYAALGRYRRFLDTAGLPYALLDREALAARIGSRFYGEGLYSPDCWLAQPAALIRALAETLPENVRVLEGAPVEGLERDAAGWRLECGGRVVRAEQVVLANNAFAGYLAPAASRIVAMYTSAGLTEPLADAELARLGGDECWGLLPAHRLGSTLRRTADGRLLVRALHGYQKETAPGRVASDLAGCLQRRFPDIRIPPFAATWSGATGYTLGGGPLWGPLAEGLWIAAGCNGGGVVKGTLFGRALAERMAGVPHPDIEGLFGRARWLPPEPFRRIGFEAASAWQTRQGAAER